MKKIFTLFNLFFITAAIYFIVDGFYRTVTAKMGYGELSMEANKPVASAKIERSRRLSFYRAITERNLFNLKKEELKKDRSEPDIGKLEQTKLNLKLWGTVTGEVDKAYAVIEDKKTRQQDLYHIGDSIQNATVKRILRGKVVLSVDDRDEILEMEETLMASRDSGRSQQTYEPRTSQSEESSQKITLQRSLVDNALRNINDLMGQVKIRPHFKDGKPDGLMLSSIRSTSIFKKMGLRNGDIITAVDGRQIESVDDALQFYEHLRAATDITLELKRRGQTKTMEYTFD